MPRVDLTVAEIAGWRALLTEAQLAAKVFLSEAVEEYVVCLLYRALGRPGVADERLGYIEQLIEQGLHEQRDHAAAGDQCLLFAGMFPEHAIRKGIPITYFVQLGQHAYRESAARAGADANRAVFPQLAAQFVSMMDVLQTLRELHQDAPCIDALTAYHLWHEAGSAHAWQVLRQLTPALPATGSNHLRH